MSDEGSWVKEYGVEGWKWRVRQDQDDAVVETSFSMLGFEERSAYPRWMVTWPIIPFLAALVFASTWILAEAVSERDVSMLLFGLVVLGVGALFSFVLYRVYYAPPKDARAWSSIE